MSDLPASSSAPADDFIHVTLESSINASLTDSISSSKSQYCQVVFHDLSEVYPTDGDICFTYSFQPGVIPQVGDRIALYKVGWSSVSEYITSIFANPPEENASFSSRVNKITFPVENLPKDEVNMYQFCYITTGNIVAGSSIPFTFRKPHGSELVAVEDPNDSGLVVFRSRVTQLQEQVFKSNAEKEALEKTIHELKSELYLIKAEVNEKVQKCDLHKESIHDMTSVIYELNTEKKELMEKLEKSAQIGKQIKDLEKCKESLELEISQLKSHIESQQNDIAAKDATIAMLNEKLEKSSLVGKQVEELLKCKESLERDVAILQSKIDSQINDIAAKDATISGMNEGRRMCEEQIKQLKEELHMSGENFDQLAEAMKTQELDMKGQLDTLNKKLKEMTERSNASGAESLSLTRDIEKANNRVKSLEEIVKNKDRTLKDLLESSSEGNDITRRLFTMEDENSLLQVQVLSLEEKVQSCESENSRLAEENDALKKERIKMADQLSKMNEELRNLKHGSQPNAKGQSCGGARARQMPMPGANSDCDSEPKGPFAQFSQFIPFFTPFQGGIGTSVNVNTSSGESPTPSTSKAPECEKCHELDIKIKGLMSEKADIRSELIQTKHANEEYCRHLREVNEEAAALRSRIAVLEIELRKAKETSITNQGEQKFKHMYDALSNSWKIDASMESSSEFRPDDSAEKRVLKESLQRELETKALLQRNNEALMILEAKNFATIDKLKKENVKLTSELAKVSGSLVFVEEMRQALEEADLAKADLAKNLQVMTAEKAKLETQLIELRKESVGKVSLTTLQQLTDENELLKKQIGNQDCCKKLREKLEAAGEAAGLSIGRITQQQQGQSLEGWSIPSSVPAQHVSSGSAFICPVCMVNFPPDSANAYNKHFSDHFD